MTPEEKELLKKINEKLSFGNLLKGLILWIVFCIWCVVLTSCSTRTLPTEPVKKGSPRLTNRI